MLLHCFSDFSDRNEFLAKCIKNTLIVQSVPFPFLIMIKDKVLTVPVVGSILNMNINISN